jgi:hypothetical protein
MQGGFAAADPNVQGESSTQACSSAIQHWTAAACPVKLLALVALTCNHPTGGQLLSGRCTTCHIQRTEARAMAVRLAARPASPDWAAATAATAAADASAVAAAAARAPPAAASRDAASAMLATRLAVMLPHAAQQAAAGSR